VGKRKHVLLTMVAAIRCEVPRRGPDSGVADRIETLAAVVAVVVVDSESWLDKIDRIASRSLFACCVTRLVEVPGLCVYHVDLCLIGIELVNRLCGLAPC